VKPFSLSGTWSGSYTYGEGYPVESQDRPEPFLMYLTEDDACLQGTCTDPITAAHFDRPATVEGMFADNYISFIKRYPSRVLALEHEGSVVLPDEPADEIHYTGTLRRHWLTRRPYFKGEWCITTAFVDEEGDHFYYTVYGSWTMRKLRSR